MNVTDGCKGILPDIAGLAELLSPAGLADDVLASLNAAELAKRQFRVVARVAVGETHHSDFMAQLAVKSRGAARRPVGIVWMGSKNQESQGSIRHGVLETADPSEKGVCLACTCFQSTNSSSGRDSASCPLFVSRNSLTVIDLAPLRFA